MGIRVKERLSMSYLCTNILSEEAIQEAKDHFYSHQDDVQQFHQDYNLFDVERLDLKDSLGFLQGLKDFSRLDKFTGSYILKYTAGSFARVHADNNSAMTIVTQLETSDLVGGLPIIRKPYTYDHRPAHKIARRHKEEQLKPPNGDPIVFDYILEMEDGKSVVYDDSLYHGVSYVHSGHRIVLVTWFQREKEGEESESN